MPGSFDVEMAARQVNNALDLRVKWKNVQRGMIPRNSCMHGIPGNHAPLNIFLFNSQ